MTLIAIVLVIPAPACSKLGWRESDLLNISLIKMSPLSGFADFFE
jgi:hypothetical protein